VKKCLLILLSLSFTFCIAIVSYASDSQKEESHNFKLQQASKAMQITGTVKSINEGAGSLAVTKKFKDKTIEVIVFTDKETKIAKGDVQQSFQDIKTDDSVVVVYTKKGAVNLAKSISLQ
jgi:uncharacterized protein YpmS